MLSPIPLFLYSSRLTRHILALQRLRPRRRIRMHPLRIPSILILIVHPLPLPSPLRCRLRCRRRRRRPLPIGVLRMIPALALALALLRPPRLLLLAIIFAPEGL